jgi:hypothetical protein
MNLGRWFARKISRLAQRMETAENGAKGSGITLKTLREQWSLQVEAQTKEKPSMSAQRICSVLNPRC